MKLRDVMTNPVIRINPEESVAVAARLMARHNVGALPVRAGDGSLCGIVTDRDMVLRCLAIDRSPEKTSVARVKNNPLFFFLRTWFPVLSPILSHLGPRLCDGPSVPYISLRQHPDKSQQCNQKGSGKYELHCFL